MSCTLNLLLSLNGRHILSLRRGVTCTALEHGCSTCPPSLAYLWAATCSKTQSSSSTRRHA